MDERVSFRAAYERFPTSVRGAFVLRGADGLPHQVRIEGARAVELGGRGSPSIAIVPTIIEVAPTLDTFVPFELPTMELGAGWYQLECAVQIDGDAETVRPGDRFLVAWPRSAVRRGTVAVDARAAKAGLGPVECAGDSVRIGFHAEKPPHVRLSVDGTSHPLLEIEHDPDTGKGRVIAYPVLRQHHRLRIEIRDADPVEVALP
jgi:hypothetical protein